MKKKFNLDSQTIGQFTHIGTDRVARISIMRNEDGTWTVGGPHEMRDFAHRKTAVKWIKRVYSAVNVAWSE